MISVKNSKINPAHVVWISDDMAGSREPAITIQFVWSYQTMFYKDVHERDRDYKNLEAWIDNYLLQKQNTTIHEGS